MQKASERIQEKGHQESGSKSSPEDQPEVRILVAEGNEGTHTYDGVDICGGRVADEIEREVRRIEADGCRGVRDISIMGYSVGGRECLMSGASCSAPLIDFTSFQLSLVT
jgi:hypothetical protein